MTPNGRLSTLSLLLLTHSFGIATAVAEQAEPAKESLMVIEKVTPVLLTQDVEACIEFWAEFGLKAVMTVPGQDQLIFAILANGNVELMYQTFESAAADSPSAIEGINRAAIYLEVESLDKILPVATKYVTVKPEHTTAYGAREIYIRDPAGNLVGFAEQSKKSE